MQNKNKSVEIIVKITNKQTERQFIGENKNFC